MANKNIKKSNTQKTEGQVTEDQLLKALGELEGEVAGDDEEEFEKADDESDESEESEESEDESMGKAHTAGQPGMPDDTDEANGGLADEGDLEGDLDVKADKKDPTGASMKSLVRDNSTLRKGFEVSDFLEELTAATVKSVDGLRKSVLTQHAEQSEFNERIQNAVVAIGNMMLEMRKSISGIEEQPVAVQPRSIVRKSDVQERFEEPAQTGFSRQQTLEALTSLVMKGSMQPFSVSAYESTGYVDPNHVSMVEAELKALNRR